MTRDLPPGARALVRGAGWPFYAGGVAFGVVVAAGIVQEAGALRWDLRAVLVLGLVTAVLSGLAWALRWLSYIGVWETDPALVARLPMGRWVRIPWSEISGLGWSGSSPSLSEEYRRTPVGAVLRTTTGTRWDRPNPDWWAVLVTPLLGHGRAEDLWVAAGRHGVPWSEGIDPRVIERWATDRYDMRRAAS